MYLELFVEGQEPIRIAMLAWSHGMSSSDYRDSSRKQQKKETGNPLLQGNPKKWTEAQVDLWLEENGLNSIKAAFQNKIRGKDLNSVSNESLKEMDINVIDRIRFQTSFSEILDRWVSEDDDDTTEPRINLQDLSVTCWMDDRAFLASYLLLNKTVIPRAIMTTYHGSRHGRNRNNRIDEIDDGVQKVKDNDPLYRLDMKNVKITSISTGGSGGEDRLTCNLCVSFDSFSFIGQQFPDSHKKSYRDFFPLPFGVEVQFNAATEKATLREWGKISEWTHKNHFSFPEEFQTIVKTLLLVHGRKEDGNNLQYLPDSILDFIIYKLSSYYLPSSPFKDCVFPGPVAEEGAAAVVEDDYY